MRITASGTSMDTWYGPNPQPGVFTPKMTVTGFTSHHIIQEPSI
jgi:hypothetical protein